MAAQGLGLVGLGELGLPRAGSGPSAKGSKWQD